MIYECVSRNRMSALNNRRDVCSQDIDYLYKRLFQNPLFLQQSIHQVGYLHSPIFYIVIGVFHDLANGTSLRDIDRFRVICSLANVKSMVRCNSYTSLTVVCQACPVNYGSSYASSHFKKILRNLTSLFGITLIAIHPILFTPLGQGW